jgi:hypothetical protein
MSRDGWFLIAQITTPSANMRKGARQLCYCDRSWSLYRLNAPIAVASSSFTSKTVYSLVICSRS